MSKRIVLVGERTGISRVLQPLLERPEFDAAWVPLGRAAIARKLRFDVLIVIYPLADMELGTLIASVRRSGSASAQPQVLVLAQEDRLREAIAYEDDSVSVLAADRPEMELRQAAASFLGMVPRKAMRVMVRLEAKLGVSKVLRACQTENISATGVLVRSSQPVPIGTVVSLELSLPDGDPPPLQVEAEVVRHTRPEIEGLRGMGLRFNRFRRDGEARLQRFISKNLG